jgi:murein DD-endopeptidase MepM/ murein hydrolase activator NlpD
MSDDFRMTYRVRRVRAAAALVSAGALLLSACAPSTVLRRAFPPSFPHEEYAQSLREAGLDRTALGRDWLAAAQGALHTTLRVTPPYRETGYFAPNEAGAVAYRFDARRGQRLRIEVELEASEPGRLFIDLFRQDAGSDVPEHAASAPTGTSRLEHEATHDGTYLIRLQPELLRGGRYTLTQHALGSLRFPVLGKDARAVTSGFGAARDRGQREHHGIDIPAPRGTLVLSAGDGIVTSVAVTEVGGKVVWVWDPSRELSLYYAHLDSQGVSAGARVRAGDTLGTVGNTGNARTTVPHLHFGVYDRRDGPLDPMPFVHDPPAGPPALVADPGALGTWRRIAEAAAPLSTSPVDRGRVVAELPRDTVIRVQAGIACASPTIARGSCLPPRREPRACRSAASAARSPAPFATSRRPQRRRSSKWVPSARFPCSGASMTTCSSRSPRGGPAGWRASPTTAMLPRTVHASGRPRPDEPGDVKTDGELRGRRLSRQE